MTVIIFEQNFLPLDHHKIFTIIKNESDNSVSQSDISEQQWKLLEPYLLGAKTGGRKQAMNFRELVSETMLDVAVLNPMFWRLA